MSRRSNGLAGIWAEVQRQQQRQVEERARQELIREYGMDVDQPLAGRRPHRTGPQASGRSSGRCGEFEDE
ncbi:hypothetical protein [Streptomyces sp. NPDC058694]|uniref:hypothetical protein n=1 Tax=Streptomyces sp. NPDC058694 TaxID=3346603 RepID=UPI0036596E00